MGRPDGNHVTRWRTAFEVSTTIAMLCLAAALVWRGWPTGTVTRAAATPGPGGLEAPVEPVSIAGGPAVGSLDAPIVMIQYADFECPYCASFATKTMPLLVDEYVRSGKLQIVFKQFPLSIHSRAEAAAIASVCAWQQDDFWSMHDELFGRLGKLSDNDLLEVAGAIGLDLDRFRTCQKDGRTRTLVAEDLAEAELLGVRATPSFLVGYREGDGVKVVDVIVGAQQADAFRTSMDRLLEDQSK